MSGADGGAITAAVEAYIRRHRSAGLYRLVDDLLKDAGLLPAFALHGAAEVRGGEVLPPRPGTPEWWAALSAVRDAVMQLEAAGIVEYIQGLEVVNFRGNGNSGGSAGGPGDTGAPARAPAATKSASNKGAPRRRATLDPWL